MKRSFKSPRSRRTWRTSRGEVAREIYIRQARGRSGSYQSAPTSVSNLGIQRSCERCFWSAQCVKMESLFVTCCPVCAASVVPQPYWMLCPRRSMGFNCMLRAHQHRPGCLVRAMMSLSVDPNENNTWQHRTARACTPSHARSRRHAHRHVYTRRALAHTEAITGGIFPAPIPAMETLSLGVGWATLLLVIFVPTLLGATVLLSLLRTYQLSAARDDTSCGAHKE
jgi:hypothetical protein